jgi:cytochrome P450 family 135
VNPRLPPGPRHPRTLQTVGWVARPGPFMERCRERYGDVFTIRIRNEGTWVFLAHPDHVREVFTGDPAVLRAGEANAILRPLVGSRSVLLLDGPEHMRERKLMLPPFHGARMQRYGEIMDAAAEEQIAAWPKGEPFALWPSMQAITLEVIMRAVFGLEEGAQLERMRALLGGMLEFTMTARSLALMALLGPGRFERFGPFRRSVEPVDAELRAEIARRRADPDLHEREDILSMMLAARYEDGSAMGEQELRDELVTLLVAGHETTATSLAWALERLMRHPQALERLRADLQDGSEEYLEAVVQETLRLRPVLPIVVRRLAEPLRIAGYDLPAGAAVVPCIYLIHRRADLYPDPHGFRPERFLERAQPDDPGAARSGEPGWRAGGKPGTYTWIPFGGGVRRCLGAAFAQFEMKRVLRAVVLGAELRAREPRPERVIRRSITLAPEHRTEAVLERRVAEDAIAA